MCDIWTVKMRICRKMSVDVNVTSNSVPVVGVYSLNVFWQVTQRIDFLSGTFSLALLERLCLPFARRFRRRFC
jgi:hypothetical protein